MKTEQEIREELHMHEMSDVWYAVISDNDYIRYIGPDRERAIKLAETWNDSLIAMSDLVLSTFIKYGDSKYGQMGLYLLHDPRI